MSAFTVFSIYSVSFLFVLLDFSKVNIKCKEHLFNIFCVVLIFVAATKTEVTSYDTNNYINLFNSAQLTTGYSFLNGYEPGYYFLNVIVRSFGFSYHVFFFITSSIVIIVYRFIILKTCKNIFTALFVYISCFYFLNEIIILRHGIATSFIMLEMYFLAKEKRKRAFICFIIAVSMHFASFVGIIPLFIKVSKRSLQIFFIFLPLAFLVNDVVLINIFNAIVSMFNNDTLNGILGKIQNHLKYEQGAGIKRVVLYLPYLIFVYITNKRGYSYLKNRFHLTSSLFFVLAIYFMLIFNSFASFSRLNQILLASTIFLSSAVTEICKKKKYYFIVYLLFIALNLYFFARQNLFNSSGNQLIH